MTSSLYQCNYSAPSLMDRLEYFECTQILLPKHCIAWGSDTRSVPFSCLHFLTYRLFSQSTLITTQYQKMSKWLLQSVVHVLVWTKLSICIACKIRLPVNSPPVTLKNLHLMTSYILHAETKMILYNALHGSLEWLTSTQNKCDNMIIKMA